MYRKPDGEYTEDAEEMTSAWSDLARPIEEATGYVLYAFCLNLSFQSLKGWPTVQLPVEFVRALVGALEKGA